MNRALSQMQFSNKIRSLYWHTSSKTNKPVCNYKLLLDALVLKLNSNVLSVSLSEMTTAFMIMASAAIDDTHSLSTLAVAANNIFAEANVKTSSRQLSTDIDKNV